LPRSVGRKRVVLERIELRQDGQPGSLRKCRKICGQRRKPDEAGETGDSDHRRDEDKTIGPFEPLVVKRVQRIFERERAAI
jgi:hypothetical protein